MAVKNKIINCSSFCRFLRAQKSYAKLVFPIKIKNKKRFSHLWKISLVYLIKIVLSLNQRKIPINYLVKKTSCYLTKTIIANIYLAALLRLANPDFLYTMKQWSILISTVTYSCNHRLRLETRHHFFQFSL